MLRKDRIFFKDPNRILKMKNIISEIKIILDDSVQHGTLHQAFSNVNTLYKHSTSIKTKKLTLIQYN